MSSTTSATSTTTTPVIQFWLRRLTMQNQQQACYACGRQAAYLIGDYNAVSEADRASLQNGQFTQIMDETIWAATYAEQQQGGANGT